MRRISDEYVSKPPANIGGHKAHNGLDKQDYKTYLKSAAITGGKSILVWAYAKTFYNKDCVI
jgi:hypothetical protein